MLDDVFAEHGTEPAVIASAALLGFRRLQVPCGAVLADPAVHTMDNWDNVHVLKAATLWRGSLPQEWRVPTDELIDDVLGWLRTRETPVGALTWGGASPGPTGYCSETTAEYIAALVRLGRTEDARRRAAFLRARQRPGGEWEVEHAFLPTDARALPSVTGFVLDALLAADVPPFDLEAALDHLARAQRPAGHFGTHRWYYDTPYYFLRAVTGVLARYGYHAAVAAVRDFVLAGQSEDGYWPANDAEHSSAEFHTALAVETLAHAGLGTEHAAVRRAVGWLLERRRQDGSWAGGWYPDHPEVALAFLAADAGADSFGRTQQDVYTTAQVLSAFHHVAELEAHHGALA